MLEYKVEARLKRLELYGFGVLKLRTPGYIGTKDRLILSPKWSPSPRGPSFVEVKRPGKVERVLQAAVRDDWIARGCDVRKLCSTFDEIDDLCDDLLYEAVFRRNAIVASLFKCDLPEHIHRAFSAAVRRRGLRAAA